MKGNIYTLAAWQNKIKVLFLHLGIVAKIELFLIVFMLARITSLQEEVKNLKNNLERVETERKQAQDTLNHCEKVR